MQPSKVVVPFFLLAFKYRKEEGKVGKGRGRRKGEKEDGQERE